MADNDNGNPFREEVLVRLMRIETKQDVLLTVEARVTAMEKWQTRALALVAGVGFAAGSIADLLGHPASKLVALFKS